jgi:serralysin
MSTAHPHEPGSGSMTIADIVLESGGSFDQDDTDFDILLQALQATSLVDAVADPDADLTVFAPTDDAFDDLAESLGADVADGDEAGTFGAIVDALTALSPDGDPIPLLQDVLLYHVSAGGKTFDEIEAAGEVETLLGSTFQVENGELIDADPTIENPRFVDGATDIAAANGTIQVLDGVLLPIDVPEPSLMSGSTVDLWCA